MRDQHVAPDRPATSALRRADRDARDAEPCAAEGDPQLTFFKAAFRDTEQGPGGHRGGHGPLLPARRLPLEHPGHGRGRRLPRVNTLDVWRSDIRMLANPAHPECGSSIIGRGRS